MPDAVNPRSYNTTRRQQEATLRRRKVVVTAMTLIGSVGYAAMTMTELAQQAGVSVEFIYKAFGDKVRLTQKLLDVAASGDDEPVPVAQRPEVQAMIAEPNARAVLRRYADLAAAINLRAADLLVAISAAAPTDPRLQQVWTLSQTQRLTGAENLVANIERKAALRVSRDLARDLVWTLNSPEVYQLFTRHRSWTQQQYIAWLADSLTAGLLDPAHAHE